MFCYWKRYPDLCYLYCRECALSLYFLAAHPPTDSLWCTPPSGCVWFFLTVCYTHTESLLFPILVGKPSPLTVFDISSNLVLVLSTLSLCVDRYHCCIYFHWHYPSLSFTSEGLLTYSISPQTHAELIYLLSDCVYTFYSKHPFTAFWPILVFREWVNSSSSHTVMENHVLTCIFSHPQDVSVFQSLPQNIIQMMSWFCLNQWVHSWYSILDSSLWN